jgi:two-component system chemotaxis response regulator CheB
MPGPERDPIRQTVDTVEHDRTTQIDGERRGQVSLFTCPECGGTLWQVDEAAMVLFRCHVGHIYAAEGLLAAQSEVAENAAWAAIRTLTDSAVLARQLARKARAREESGEANRLEEQGRVAEQRARAFRELLEASVPG